MAHENWPLVDRRLESLIGAKGDAAEFVLAGHLLGEHASEVNLAELLDTARKEFAASSNTIPTVDESELELPWPALRAELATTVKAWNGLIRSVYNPKAKDKNPELSNFKL